MKYRHENIIYFFEPQDRSWVLQEMNAEGKIISVAHVGTKRQLEMFYPQFKFIPYEAEKKEC